jgi:hypothetical protein
MSAIEDYLNSKKQPEQAVEELLGEKLEKKSSPGMFMKLLDLLDRPGNATRALLIGKLGGLKGLIPFAQLIEDLTGYDIALNKEDRVAGTEIIEKFFGKQKQRPGKIDPVDALGLIVEIAADPLWLLGGGGLTKLGKSKSLVMSAIKGAAKEPEQLAKIGKAIRAAKAGQPIADDVVKQLSKSIRTVYGSGQTASMGKTWASQAARGERGLLNVLGKQAIKGEKVLGGLEKFSTAAKRSKFGKLFTPPTQAVSPKYEELGDIAIHLTRNVPEKQQSKLLSDLVRMKTKIAGVGDEVQIDRLLTDYAEQSLGAAKTPELINKMKSSLSKQYLPRLEKSSKQVSKTQKRIQTQEKNLLAIASNKLRSQSRVRGHLDELKSKLKQQEGAFGRLRQKVQKEVSEREANLTARGQQLQTGAEDILRQIPADKQKTFKELVAEGTGKYEKFASEEIANRVPINRLERQLGYSRRLLTDEARQFLADKNMTERFLARGRQLRVKNASQKTRGKLGAMTRDEIQQVFKDIGFEKDVFDPSFVRSIWARGTQSAKTTGAAKTFMSGASKFSKTRQWLDDAIQRGITKPDEWVDLQLVMNRSGLKVGGKEFVNRVIPKEVGEALLEMQRVMTSPDAMNEFWKVYTGATRYMKGAFTQFFPAYHGRNAISNVFLNWLGGVKNPLSYANAAALQKAASATRRLAKKAGISFEDAAKQVQWPTVNGIHGAQLWDIADQYGVVGRVSSTLDVAEFAGRPSDILKPHVGGAKGAVSRHLTGTDVVSQSARGVGTEVENNSRLAHFIEKMGQGYNYEDAAKSTKKFLFDYGNLAEWEKKYMRDRGIFFYSFARKNLPLQIETLIKQPGKQAVFSHLAGGTPRIQGEGKYQNDWENEQLNIPLPIRNKEGNQFTIRGTGLPIEEAFGPLSGSGTGAFNRISKVASRTLGRANPFIKAPMELAFKKNLYFGTDIRDPVDWAVQQTPVGRFRSTVRGITGPETPEQKALRYTTGLRYGAIDPEERKSRKLRQIARDYLEQNKKAKVYRRYYSKDETDDLTRKALELQ